ncbi:MAG: leucine-rich repeat protein [Clostridia bacterium]|nr:leucine-rich repeat protein [Clostridia bacterium]
MNELMVIKRKYGEAFSHFCRDNFSSILENEGQLIEVLENEFYPNKFLLDDMSGYKKKEFVKYIHSLCFPEVEEEEVDVNATPEELFDAAGYILYKCETNEDVQSFRKYYAEGEEICTFGDENRINTHDIFFAVKKNADEIRREDFENPQREDEYGTSVISLQFTKGKNSILSIKNRYNHTVANPDATFSNNPDNIKKGLTESFKKFYGIQLLNNVGKFELPKYVLAKDGRRYRYTGENNNIYYCVDNIIVDNGNVKQFDKSRYILMDYFLLDRQAKSLTIAGNEDMFRESFHKGHKDIADIEVTNGENGEKDIKLTSMVGRESHITINAKNQIIGYSNPHLKELSENFLREHTSLTRLDVPNVTKICDYALHNEMHIEDLDLQNVTVIGFRVLEDGAFTKRINLPNCKKIGKGFMRGNIYLKVLDLPEVREIGNDCFQYNKDISRLYAPKCKSLGSFFMYDNRELTSLDLESVERIDDYCFSSNRKINHINTPKLKHLDNYCFTLHPVLSKTDAKAMREITKNGGMLEHELILG